MSLNVDYAAGDAKMRSKYYYTMNGNYVTNVNQNNQANIKLKQQEGDTFISSLTGAVGSGNTCTDGIDDGKIGLGGVVANVAQGAVRTIPNMIKGAFTNSEGKFSLAKTALTIGIGAACVAFPAVGLALCAVGMGAGAIKAGSNVVKALNSDTDAEAKAAWENVGSGATTAALSYVGAKASYNAVEASAGEASVLKGANLLEYAKENGVKQTVVDLAKDCFASTKNNGAKISEAVGSFRSNSKLTSQAKELNNLENINADKLTEAQSKRLNELKSNPKVCEKASELKAASEAKAAAKTEYKDTQKQYNEAKTEQAKLDKEYKNLDKKIKKIDGKADESGALSEADLKQKAQLSEKQAGVSEKLAESNNKLASAKTAYQNASQKTTFGKFTNMASNTANSVKAALKNSRGKITPASVVKSAKSLGADGVAVAKALMDKSISDQTIISQFGYDKVGQVLAVLAGENSTDNIL